jgi:hypothetical protein
MGTGVASKITTPWRSTTGPFQRMACRDLSGAPQLRPVFRMTISQGNSEEAYIFLVPKDSCRTLPY